MSVRVVSPTVIHVTFADGTSGEVDMGSLIHGKNPGVFTALRDARVFEQVYVELGAVTWPGEVDLAPDAMYDEIKAHGRFVIPE